MSLRALFLSGFFSLWLGVGAALAQPTAIAGLYTTGLNGAGALLGHNQVDANYVVTASSRGVGYTGSAYSVRTNAIPAGWTANTTSARWVVGNKPGGGDGNDPSRPSGTFDYTINFDLPAGAQVYAVSITGMGAADDSATIYVNGILVVGQTLTGAGATNSFTLNSSNATFLHHNNTLTFRVNNVTNPSATGLLITSLSGTANVPEVGAFLPVAGALALLAGIRVWRRRTSPR